MKRNFKIVIVMLTAMLLLVACSKSNEEEKPKEVEAGKVEAEKRVEEKELEGNSLMIFCGAGMKNSFEKIAQEFQETTGCDVQVTYGNAAQIHTQINTAKEGDFFIAGSAEEVKPVEEWVTSSKDLVKHIPVLVVAKGNPKEINEPEDLVKEGVSFIMGDPEATPIGKIANKLMSEFKIKDKINIIANTATAPAMITAIEAGEADAGLVWKENVQSDKIEIVNSKAMEKYIKTIPAAMLNVSKDEKAQKIFNEYLDTQGVKNIWIDFGYEIVE